MHSSRTTLILVLPLLLAGCSDPDLYSGSVYTADQAKQVQSVTYGTIVSVRPVKIQTSEHGNILGSLGGAVIGGLLGSTVGNGRGQDLATVGGALGGGMAGSKIEQKANRVDGLELEIKKDDGSAVVVVQKAEPSFQPGARVRLVKGQGKVNVSPIL